MKETKNIDTENTVVTDTVKETSERGVKLTQPIERGGEKITYVEITGAIEQSGSLRDLSLSDVLSVITLVCFEHIEDLVADIAAIFNWSPAEIFMMTPGEVVSWRERAALRSGNADNEDS